VRICEALGAMRVAWTARPADDHAKLTRRNDAIIFEHYRPIHVFKADHSEPDIFVSGSVL
jgi:hypothetical protein